MPMNRPSNLSRRTLLRGALAGSAAGAVAPLVTSGPARAADTYDCIVVGVSPDDCLTHAEFRDQEGLSVRLLSDADTDVCRLYKVWQQREVDGIKKMGVRRSTFIIDKDGIIRHALYDVAPRGHVAAVFELVKELGSKTCKMKS